MKNDDYVPEVSNSEFELSSKVKGKKPANRLAKQPAIEIDQDKVEEIDSDEIDSDEAIDIIEIDSDNAINSDEAERPILDKLRKKYKGVERGM